MKLSQSKWIGRRFLSDTYFSQALHFFSPTSFVAFPLWWKLLALSLNLGHWHLSLPSSYHYRQIVFFPSSPAAFSYHEDILHESQTPFFFLEGGKVCTNTYKSFSKSVWREERGEERSFRYIPLEGLLHVMPQKSIFHHHFALEEEEERKKEQRRRWRAQHDEGWFARSQEGKKVEKQIIARPMTEENTRKLYVLYTHHFPPPLSQGSILATKKFVEVWKLFCKKTRKNAQKTAATPCSGFSLLIWMWVSLPDSTLGAHHSQSYEDFKWSFFSWWPQPEAPRSHPCNHGQTLAWTMDNAFFLHHELPTSDFHPLNHVKYWVWGLGD